MGLAGDQAQSLRCGQRSSGRHARRPERFRPLALALALAYAKLAKGRFRGLQTGVGVIAAMVATQVDAAARNMARQELVRDFAAFAWPVVVDLTAGDVLAHEGKPKIGRLYNSWMCEQIDVALPPPPSWV